MKCQNAEKYILLQDSGELPNRYQQTLSAHLDTCEPCRTFQQALTESQQVFQTLEDPSAKAMQNVLRAARVNAPEKKTLALRLFKPALATAASLLLLLGFFSLALRPDKVGMEFVVTDESQLLAAEDQAVSVMYDGYSEDDLAFNFLMTHEEG